MPTPEGLKTTVIHGQYAEPNLAATPLQGTVTFTATPTILTFPTQNLIVAGTETATLDANGEFNIELISTDQAGENPTGWTYSVTEKLVNIAPRTYAITLPYNSGVTVELADITPTVAAPTYLPVTGPIGPGGVITFVNGKTGSSVTLTSADVTALDVSTRGAVNGVASLDAGTKVPVGQLPDLSGTYILTSRIGAASGVASLGTGSLVPSTQLDLAAATPTAIANIGAVGTATKLAREDHTHAGVALTGTQTIAGIKTWTGNQFITGSQFGVGLITGLAGRTHLKSVVDEIALVVEQTTITGTNPLLQISAFDNTMTLLAGKVAGDTANRISLRSSGNIQMGPGSGALDTTIYRSAATIVNSTGQFASDAATPTAISHLTRKDYVDGLDVANVKLTGTQTVAGIKTFSAIPIFSTGATFNGQVTLSATSILISRTAVTDNAYRANLTGDANSRVIINADGKILWGSGSAASDTNLYRSNIDELTTDDALIVTKNLSTAGDFSIQGRAQGRGLLTQFTRTAPVSGWSTETVLMTVPSTTYVNGRAYRMTIWGRLQMSVGTAWALLIIRKATVTGTIYSAAVREGVPTGGVDAYTSMTTYFKNTSGADIVTAIVLTGQASSGTGTWNADSSSSMSFITVEDIGLASDWPGMPIT